MPPQIKRLLPLFAIFIALFLLVRHFLVPASFGEYGHYRGLSLQENAAVVPHYAGKAACIECHGDVNDSLTSDVHTVLSCEVCHGPGLSHANNPDSVSLNRPSGRNFCGLCHSFNPSRPAGVIKEIDLSNHYVDKDCIQCHNPHKPWELKDL